MHPQQAAYTSASTGDDRAKAPGSRPACCSIWGYPQASPPDSEKALDEALCDPSEMCKKGRVDVNERISCRELLPGRRDTAKALNDPLISVEEVCVSLQVLLVRDLAAACSELGSYLPDTAIAPLPLPTVWPA